MAERLGERYRKGETRAEHTLAEAVALREDGDRDVRDTGPREAARLGVERLGLFRERGNTRRRLVARGQGERPETPLGRHRRAACPDQACEAHLGGGEVPLRHDACVRAFRGLRLSHVGVDLGDRPGVGLRPRGVGDAECESLHAPEQHALLTRGEHLEVARQRLGSHLALGGASVRFTRDDACSGLLRAGAALSAELELLTELAVRVERGVVGRASPGEGEREDRIRGQEHLGPLDVGAPGGRGEGCGPNGEARGDRTHGDVFSGNRGAGGLGPGFAREQEGSEGRAWEEELHGRTYPGNVARVVVVDVTLKPTKSYRECYDSLSVEVC